MKKLILVVILAGCAGTKATPPMVIPDVRVVSANDSTTAADDTLSVGITFVSVSDRDSAIVLSNRGVEAFKVEDYVLAEKYFRKACKLDPNELAYKIYLANSWDRVGMAEEAIGLYEKVVEMDKGRSDVYFALGLDYHRLGRDSLAVKSLEQAIRVFKNVEMLEDSTAQVPMEYWEVLGDSHVGLNDAKAALGAFQQALAVASTPVDSSWFRDRIAWVSWSGGVPSHKAWDSAIKATADSLFELAVQDYEEAMWLAETWQARAELAYYLGRIRYQYLAEPQAAMATLRGFAKSDSSCREALGVILHNEGVKGGVKLEGLGYLSEAAQLGWKGRAGSCLELAKLYSQFPAKTAEAVRFAEKAVELGLPGERQREACSLLVVLHRRLGNFEAMKKWKK